jgi:microcystin-dependent protein
MSDIPRGSSEKLLQGSILPGLTQAETETLNKVFSSPLDIPAEWKAWLISYLEANPPQIPISQILGFTQASTPVGTIFPYGGDTAPEGFLLCDGQAVSRDTFALLFGVIASKYGAGDGSTTFNVPDFRGRVPTGKGTHADVNTLGKSDGVTTVAFRRPRHRHTPHAHAIQNFFNVSTANYNDTGGGRTLGVATVATDLADGGSGNANDSLDAPAFLVVNFIIKT